MTRKLVSLSAGIVTTLLRCAMVMVWMKNLLRIPMACPLKVSLIPKEVVRVWLNLMLKCKRLSLHMLVNLVSSHQFIQTPRIHYMLEEKLMPKLVIAESCVVEGIPDPRSNDNTELQQLCDPKLQSDAQEVLPPGPTLRSSPPRERKSRSVSANKRGCVNKTRPASFARSVSPTISKVQAGHAKEQLKSWLQKILLHISRKVTPQETKITYTRLKLMFLSRSLLLCLLMLKCHLASLRTIMSMLTSLIWSKNLARKRRNKKL